MPRLLRMDIKVAVLTTIIIHLRLTKTRIELIEVVIIEVITIDENVIMLVFNAKLAIKTNQIVAVQVQVL